MTKTKAQLRAEAVERLDNYETNRYKFKNLAHCILGDRYEDVSFEANRLMLINLLTDDETCPNNNGTCLVTDGTISNVPSDTEPQECGRITFVDTREWLEADICVKLNDMARFSWRVDEIMEQAKNWLDRQAAITRMEDECACHNYTIEQVEALEEENRLIRERLRSIADNDVTVFGMKLNEVRNLQAKVVELEAENAELKRKMSTVRGMARKFRNERDEQIAKLQVKVDELEAEIAKVVDA